MSRLLPPRALSHRPLRSLCERRPPGAAYIYFAESAILAKGCSQGLALLGAYPNLSKTASVICFITGLQIGMTEDYLLVRAAYNWRTGAVWFRWTRFIYRWSDTYARGDEHLERYEQGGRTCAEALMGWGSPYNVMFCR